MFALCVGVLLCFSGGWGQGMTASPSASVCQPQTTTITVSTSNQATNSNQFTVNPVNGLSVTFPSSASFNSFDIDVSASTPGIYTIEFQRPGNHPPTSIQITIGTIIPSFFSFTRSNYCKYEDSLIPNLITNPGWTFSSIGPNTTNFTNSTTGKINLATSFVHTDSTHMVAYTTNNQGCISIDTVSFRINDYSADFDILGANSGACFTAGDSITLINIEGPGEFLFWNGTNWTSPVSNPGTSFDTTITTPIPSGLQTGATTIQYGLFSSITGCSDTDTDPLNIGLPNSTNPTYPGNFYCTSDGDTITPTISPTPPACTNCEVWSASPIGLNINASNGTFIPANATPGIYAVTYTYTHPFGCMDSYFVDSIEIRQTTQASIAYPDTFCRAGNDLIPQNTAPVPANGNFMFPPGFGITPSPFYSLDISGLSNQPSDRSFNIIYNPPPGGCVLPDTETVVVRQLMGTYSYNDTSLCKADGIELALGNPSFNADTTRYFKESPMIGTLLIDPVTGNIDPAGSDPETYKVGMEVSQGNCIDTFYADKKVNIWPTPSPGFLLDSVACTFDPDIQIMADTLGGTFTAIGPQANSLVLDPIGIIGVNQSPPGNYIINYNLDSLDCPVDTTVIFTIKDTVRSSFYYLQDTFCSTANSNLFPLPIGTSGGIYWSSDTTNTLVDSLTGALSPGGFQDNFTIYRLLDSIQCAVKDSFDIRINTGNSAFFQYPETDYCSSSDSAKVDTPSLAGLGGFFSFENTDTLSTNLLSINSSTGTIYPQSSGIDTFLVTYHLPGLSFCPDFQTTQVRIVQEDTMTSFSYPDDTLCQGSPPMLPTLGDSSDTSGRYFSFDPGVNVTSLNGEVNFSNWFSGAGEIGYSLGGVCKDTFPFSVYVTPFDEVFLNYSDSIICSSNLPIQPDTFGGTPGIFSLDTDNFLIDSLTGSISIDTSSAGGTVNAVVTYTSNIECPASETFDILIENPWSTLNPIITPGEIVCLGQEVTINTNYGQAIDYIINDSLHTSNVKDYTWTPDELMNTVEIIQQPTSRCSLEYYFAIQVNPIPEVSTPIDTMTLSAGSFLNIPFTSNLDSTRIHFWTDTIGPVWAEPGLDSTDWSASDSTLQVDLSFFTSNELVPGTVTFFAQPVSRGCWGDTTAIAFDINPGTFPIYVPEVLSPNGDNINETWVMRWNSDIVPGDYTMHVFNASHGEVARFPINTEWSPSVPDGVYWWLLKDRNQIVVQSGGLTIRRN